MSKKSTKKKNDTSQKQEDGWWEFAKTILIALVFAIVVRSFLYEPVSIPSGSMFPNLKINDFLFVAKSPYGYSRYSFPYGLPPFEGRIFGNEPQRGDVVVFKWPKDNSTNYIKRIIGMPGDKIEVKAGVVVLNDKPIPRRRIDDYKFMKKGERIRAAQYIETLPNQVSYKVLDYGPNHALDNVGTYIVPKGHYFMMGDNRDDSRDSRDLDFVGYIPFQNLVGRASMIFFSVDAPFWQVWKWPTHIRYDRLFKMDISQ